MTRQFATIKIFWWVGVPLVVALGLFVGDRMVAANPTAEEYVARVGAPAKLLPPGGYRLAGYPVRCGRRPIVLNPQFDSWGGAYPGFIILNPPALKKLPKAVRLFVFAHECGHQFRGRDEDTADSFAIRRGVRRGWLNAKGLQQICQFISKIPADSAHPPGPQRCQRMRAYFHRLTAKARNR